MEETNEIRMSRTAERMSGLTMVYSCLTMVVFMLSLLPVNERGAAVSLLLFPAAVLPGVFYLVNVLLMEHHIYLSLLLIADAVVMAAGGRLFFSGLRIDPAMPATRLFFTVAYVFCMVAALYIAWSPIRPQTVIACFDGMAAILIIYLALQKLQLTLLPVQMPALCAFSMGLSFLTMMKSRLELTGAAGASVGSVNGGRLMMAVLTALTAGAAFLIGASAAGMLHGISEGAWNLIQAAGRVLLWIAARLYDLLERFAMWLSQFFQQEEYGDVLTEEEQTVYQSQDAQMTSMQVPQWFYLLLGLVIVALFILLLYRIRRVRMDKMGYQGIPAGNMRRTGGLRAAMCGWAAALYGRILLAVRYRRKRKTPAGMLYWCERHFRKRCPRKRGESGEAYLMRLSEDPAGEMLKDELAMLSKQVAQAFYSPQADCSDPECIALYRRLRKAVHLHA